MKKRSILRKMTENKNEIKEVGITQMSDENIKRVLSEKTSEILFLNQNRKEQKKWLEKKECPICGKAYTYSNRVNHNKTNFHKIHANINKKVREFILNSK